MIGLADSKLNKTLSIELNPKLYYHGMRRILSVYYDITKICLELYLK